MGGRSLAVPRPNSAQPGQAGRRLVWALSPSPGNCALERGVSGVKRVLGVLAEVAVAAAGRPTELAFKTAPITDEMAARR